MKIDDLDESSKVALRQAMSLRIPEYQPVLDDDTVYCERCDVELYFTPSNLGLHNVRRHEEDIPE